MADEEMNLYTVHAATKRGATINLIFRDEERAAVAHVLLGSMRPLDSIEDRRGLGASAPWNPVVTVKDDYGSTVTVDREEVALAWMNDMAANANGEAEQQLFKARASVRLQERAGKDEVLREAQRRAQGAGQILPVGAGLAGLLNS